MLSKAKIKLIRSLELKKNRRSEGLFVAEGPKVVSDLLPHFGLRLLITTPSWEGLHTLRSNAETVIVTTDELAKVSFLKTPQDVLAVFELPTSVEQSVGESLVLVLDDVQDPGNLGTIIRTADWFGIRHIVCSPSTADAFSPKVVQATMGSIARVQVEYKDLPVFLTSQPAGTPVYGTFLEGDDIYRHPLSANGIIVMGNEGNGISPAISRYVTQKLFIPPYPVGAKTGESLNVAIATAITLSEFRRRSH